MLTIAGFSYNAGVLGDPQFPEFAIRKRPRDSHLELFTRLYEQYSRLDFTREWDKTIAIAGLEQRLTKFFGTRSGAGIFDRSLGNWLLWIRS